MGASEGSHRERLAALIQSSLHVQARLHETHTRTTKRQELLSLAGLGLSDRSCTVPGRLLYVAGIGAGDDQCRDQRLSSTDSRSEGHRTAGTRLMRQPRRAQIVEYATLERFGSIVRHHA